jgi:hypothetical protein
MPQPAAVKGARKASRASGAIARDLDHTAMPGWHDVKAASACSR